MSIKRVSLIEFESAFNNADLKYPEFVGFNSLANAYAFYLTEDKLSGFAVTNEYEMVYLFNANPNYTFLNDPEAVGIINSKVNWFVCIGYYEYQEGEEICGTSQRSLADYYTSKLNFDVFGETECDVEDMIDTIGLVRTAGFVKKYGLPYQTFLLNRNFPILNKGYYGKNGCVAAKKNILLYTDCYKEEQK